MNIMYNSDRHPYSFVIATCYHMPYRSLNDKGLSVQSGNAKS